MPSVLSQSSFVDAYLDRIRVEAPSTLDIRALNTLQLAHLRHVPIENTDLVLNDQHGSSLLERVVLHRRGAAATTLNVLFGLLLTGLGFRTRLLATPARSGTLTPQAVIGVLLDGAWFISDVSGSSGDDALPLDDHTQEVHPSQGSAMPEVEAAWVGTSEGTISSRTRPESDIIRALAFWEERPNAAEHRPQNLIATLRRQDGQTTLIGSVLEERAGNAVTHIHLDPSKVPEVLRERFGIALDNDEAHMLWSVISSPS
jgi:arylamine N-acetyltransferase